MKCLQLSLAFQYFRDFQKCKNGHRLEFHLFFMPFNETSRKQIAQNISGLTARLRVITGPPVSNEANLHGRKETPEKAPRT